MTWRSWWLLAWLASPGYASDLTTAIEHLALDRTATFHVRDLQLNRGGVKIYFTEGILSFFTPLDGHVLGAVFTSANVEGGDGEVLVLPPARSERASLTSFTGQPNLDEHLQAAVLYFADDTAAELRKQMERGWSQPAPELADQIDQQIGSTVRAPGASMELRLMQSLLDAQSPAKGFFYAALYGRTLPPFSVLYDPLTFEPVTIGRGSKSDGHLEGFELWSAFRPRDAGLFTPPANRFSNYRIHASVHPDLNLEATAEFDYAPDPSDGRVLRFELSDRLHVENASIDGASAEVFERPSLQATEPRLGGSFLLVAKTPLPATVHHVFVRYSGAVIRQTPSGTYFVDDRTSWYPYSPSLLSTFDLTFDCPQKLVLVSTGTLVSDEVHGNLRTVHRRSQSARPFAGFNLGDYFEESRDAPPYRVAVYSNRSQTTPVADILHPAVRILEFYTRAWNVVPLHTLSIAPIAGYFGQGFPGLVYLSDSAYVRPEDRPPALRTTRFENFLNRMLLPHEIAHQWWGNIVTAATYRSGWLIEAMANYSALQYIEQNEGSATVGNLLAQYREELKRVDATGPLDWGTRLLSSKNPAAWNTIVYGKGTWVLHMLRARLGDANFRQFQQLLLSQSQHRPFTNDDLREIAAKLLPLGPDREKDPALQQFFDSWVYNTGLPGLSLRRDGRDWLLTVTNVDDAFSVDVPIRCSGKTYLIRAASGENYLPRASRQSASCTLPDPSTFLYTN